MNKTLIGRTDKADFPELELENIAIKIDTGAYTSSMHCDNIEEKNNQLICDFLDPSLPQYHGKKITFKEYYTTKVKSSNGIVALRYAIKTKIVLFEKTYPITLTLNNRNDMRFPVLIGRKFLTKRFIVDTELTDISYLNKN